MENSEKNQNGQNMIHSFNSTDYSQGNFQGLNKREYFAGLAMQSVARDFKVTNDIEIEAICTFSIKIADELLKQLEK